MSDTTAIRTPARSVLDFATSYQAQAACIRTAPVTIVCAGYNFNARVPLGPDRWRSRTSSGTGTSARSLDADLTVAELGEFRLIERLARIVNPGGRDPLRPDVAGGMGIGDDAALWSPRRGFREVLTTDALIEG